MLTLLTRLRHAGDRRVIAYSPLERKAEFAEVASDAWELTPQAKGDLGQRMVSFFETQLAQGRDDRVVLIGTDSPTLPLAMIEMAFDALRTVPVVLGPTCDGGYYLVGATGQVPPIFAGIDWSTPSVWQQTIDRLHAASCRFAELPRWYDVDDLQDLFQVADELKQLVRTDPATWTRLSVEVQAALEALA